MTKIYVMSDAYTEAVDRLVSRYQKTIGDVAIRIARQQDTIELRDGSVSRFDGGSDELDDLIQAYEEIIGAVAVTIARQVFSDTALDVPERVES